MSFSSINPFDNSLLKNYQPLSSNALNEQIENSQKTFKHWKQVPLSKRSDKLLKLAALLKDGKEVYARLISLEMGKPIKQGIAEIEKCAWLCEYYAEHGPGFLEDEIIEARGTKHWISYQALGGVLAIMPWNFPFWQALRCAVPAVLAGNVVFLKHAPNVPQCAEVIEQLFLEAGFPSGVLINLFIGIHATHKLITHPAVQSISLTGSDRAGSAVAAQAGSQIKKCVLELGGTDAFIVLEDANIEEAVKMAAKSRMHNNGQTCIAAKRIIVQETAADEFIGGLIREIRQYKIGNPIQTNVNMGPLARRDLVDQLDQQIKGSLKLGAKFIYEGGKQEGLGNFYHPAILTGVKPGMPAFDEEVFGPVAVLYMVRDEEEAVRLANNTDYGLGAAVWSKDIERATRIGQQLEVGNVAINNMLMSDPRLPFGGVKRSGYGRELSIQGIRELVNIKTFSIG